METKSRLKEAGKGARWVKAQVGAALSSVVVSKNRMIEEGAEFVVLAKKDLLLVGTTDVVQPFEEFSAVDYGRPERDTLQGMLPPKLARIMVNLIHVSREAREVSLLDPFCGSGTILTEALQIGFMNVYGSDKNPAAAEATKKNIEWLQSKGLTQPGSKAVVEPVDAREVSKYLEDGTIDAIATEPYLGPPRSGRERRGEMQKTLHELSNLYYQSLSNWKKILKPGAPIVMALPVYIVGLEKHGISVADFAPLGLEAEPLLPTLILSRLGVRETKNHGLLYGRNDQFVWREIVRLRVAKQ
jgi:tRNA G10  N-methylase Trm11